MLTRLKPCNPAKVKSEFSCNVLTLTIPIAISPILTRIYTPEDFGKFQ